MNQKEENEWYNKVPINVQEELTIMRLELKESRAQTKLIERRTDFLISKWMELESRLWWKKS
ncbi:MAG: hypothetical protein MI975_20630 [Cytophagales bacterium]|nr:hypothetical protein [Cytophagales bacterium]